MFLNNAYRELQMNVWFRVQNLAKNSFLPLCLETCLAWKFLFLCSFLNNTHEHSKKIRFSTSSKHKNWAKTKN